MRAAIYARYSTDLQSAASIEDQTRLCEEHAQREGWDVIRCYADHGISGVSMMRPGLQSLIQDAMAGNYDILLSEALDRVSRDLEDIAGVYKRLSFAGIRIVTLSEGPIGALHIGLKGTMNALFLKDLADKTRRGLRGRIEAGKSGGGNSYGYDVIRDIGEDGEPTRGERGINKQQAAIVNRIFNEYTAGTSPRALAKRLNEAGTPGPSGKAWGPSTIHGNRQRGTGILNNELYIGKRVWNRLRYVKDPETGKRISRLNLESEWVIQDVPDLQIIDQDLWDQVKTRQNEQAGTKFGKGGPGFWDRRRPRYLFSGLMECGICGGGFTNLNADRVGCASARNKGTCHNRRTIKRDILEATVLDGLQQHLMDPVLMEVFCEEYTRHSNKLRGEQNTALTGAKAELQRTTRELDRLVQAIIDGVPGSHVKDRMGELETRKVELKAYIEGAREEPVLLHPNMAQFYRKQVGQLREALTGEDCRTEAAALMRTLIDKIVLTPAEHEGRKTLSVDLYGDIAGILSMAAQTKKPPQRDGFTEESIKLVAGVGFEPTTFRL
jgi:DNA invertase Pin-like site-specific DNA recombinase